MQLPRALLTITLVASTANALPTGSCRPGESEYNGGNLNGVSAPTQKRSHHHFASPKKVVSDYGERDAMEMAQDSVDARPHGHQEKANLVVNGNDGQQSNLERAFQPLNAPGSQFHGQSAIGSSTYKSSPSIQQRSTTMSEKPGNSERNGETDKAAASKDKMDVALKVRELINFLSQGRKQMHSAQADQENCAEPSIEVRHVTGQARTSTDGPRMDNLHQTSGVRHNQVMENSASGVQDGEMTSQEISRISTPLNLKLPRSHTGMSVAADPKKDDNRDDAKKNGFLEKGEMQSRSELMACLRAAMGDVHKQSLCVSDGHRVLPSV